MKLPYFIPNLLLTALWAVFVFSGAAVYVWERPDLRPDNPIPFPEVATNSAVLSQTTREPQLYLPPGVQPLIGLPIVSLEELAVRGAVEEVYQALSSRNSTQLLSLMTSDLSATYSPEEISQAFVKSLEDFGEVTSFKTLGEPTITGNFADQVVELTTDKGTYKFQVFLKKESGGWKLMGTESIP